MLSLVIAVSRKTLALSATSLGWLLFSVDLTMVTVALPTIGSDFSASVAQLQWVVSAYVVAVAALLLAAGVLGDRLGAPRVYVAGLLIFGASSIVSALAPDLGVLIAGRVGQGIGGAAMTATGLALLTQAYGEDAAGRTKAIGWWAAIGGVGGSVGILAGGLIVSAFGWRPLFWLNLPIVLVAILLTHRARLINLRGSLTLDALGLVALVVTVGAVVGALVTAPDGDAILVVGLVAIAAVALAISILRQRRSPDPVIPRSVLGSTWGRRSLILAVVVNTQFYAALLAMTLFFQKGLGWSAAITGLAFLPAVHPTPIAMPLVASLSTKYSPQRVLLVLTGFGAIGFLLLSLSSSSAPYAVFGFALLFMTLGTSAIVVAPLTRMLMHNTIATEAGRVSGVLTMMRQVGASIGAALLAFLAGSNAIDAAYKAGWFCLALSFVAAGVLLWRSDTKSASLKSNPGPTSRAPDE